ncbi:MAG: hypothetical protein ACK5XV_08780 [Flavobacteriales bacterium]
MGLFLEEKIGFLDIARICEETMQRIPVQSCASLEDYIASDALARRVAGEVVAVV